MLRLHLTGLLWSNRETQQARASLRQSIHELAEALGPHADRLHVERHHITLRADGVRTDVMAALAAETPFPGSFAKVLLEDLGGLDPAFDRWLDEERQKLSRAAIVMGEGRLAVQTDVVGRLGAAEDLLTIDQTHEAAWRSLMCAHAERGNRAAALGAYERCRSVLAATLHIVPGRETEDLIARIRSADLPAVRQGGEPQGAAEAVAAVVPHHPGLRLGIPAFRIIGGQDLAELSHGLAEEISTGFTRCRWISCVSGLSLTMLSPRTASMPVDFLLDGTLQRAGDRLRIMVRLLDMRSSGAAVWARRFDRIAGDIFATQEQVAAALVAQLEPELLVREGERTAAARLIDPTADDLALRAVPAVYRLEREGFQAAGGALGAAVAADPNHALAHAWYAYWHLFLVGQGWARQPAQAVERATSLAERAVTLAPNDARALTVAGHVRGFLCKHPRDALDLHKRALALNPNLALAWCFAGLSHCYLGDHDEASRFIAHAVELSPSDPHLFFFGMAQTMPHMLRGQYDVAADIGRWAVGLNPWFTSAYKGYLAALGHLGDLVRAAEVRDRLLELEPGFTVQAAIARSPMGRPEDLKRYADGLRLAGLPERGGDLPSMPPRQAELPIIIHAAH